MAYNAYSRLLLKFGEADGATTVADTSAPARTATFTAGGVSSAQGVFGTRSAAVGNPGGTIAGSAVVVGSPGGLFSDSSSSAKQFDLWFRKWGYPVTQANQPLIAIQFANGDNLALTAQNTGIECQYDGRNTNAAIYAYKFVSKVIPVNGWLHVRLLIAGNTLRIGAAGADLGSVTITPDIWTGSATNAIANVRFGLAPPIWNVDSTYRAQGYIDAIEFTEGTVSWAGGAYTVPTAEPDDAPLTPTIYGGGEAALQDVLSVGEGVILNPVSGDGQAVLDGIVGSGAGSLHRLAAGENTVQDVIGDGYIALDTMIHCVGDSVLGAVLGSGVGLVGPQIRLAAGVCALDSIASFGAGGANWVIAQAVAPVGDIVGAGEGVVANAPDPSGYGENTVSTLSSGHGNILVQGQGQNTVATSAYGTADGTAYCSGSNSVAVASYGEAFHRMTASGSVILDYVSCSGVAVLEILGRCANSVEVSSAGYARVLILGQGENTLDDVRTWDDGAWRDLPAISFMQREDRVFIRSKINHLAVGVTP